MNACQLFVGAMIVDALGTLSEASDTQNGLFPVDYRYEKEDVCSVSKLIRSRVTFIYHDA